MKKRGRKRKLKEFIEKKDLHLANLVIDELEHDLLMRKTALALSRKRKVGYIS